ncbi:glycosidase [Opitutaceae bacterium TAV1]|nr:glycosidase [Opitutaceae bacterium TAV1]
MIALDDTHASTLTAMSAPSPVPSRPWQARAATNPQIAQLAIYQIWLRSFTPEGTLAAATAQLGQVAELGANTVQLPPLTLPSTDTRDEFFSPRTRQSRAGHYKNPYRVADYETIDHDYGTEADLRAFVRTAHDHGLRVLLDVVFYHTGPDCVLLCHDDFYLRAPDGRPLLGDWNFPALNFRSPRLRDYLINNLCHWVRTADVDGFRCDVSFGVPLDFWEQARAALDTLRPDLILLAESEVPEDQLAAFDLNYNFSFYDTLKAVVTQGLPATRIREYWEIKQARFPRGAKHLYCCDNHDMDRADVVFGREGAAAAAVLCFTLDGVPFVFNGQEIGDTNPDDIMARDHPIRWNLSDYPVPAARRQLFQKLLHLRRTEPALTTGTLVWHPNTEPESVLSFTRATPGTEILVLINLSNRIRRVTVLPASVPAVPTAPHTTELPAFGHEIRMIAGSGD